MTSSPRETVLELLVRMDQSGSYSNILLDNTLSREKLRPRDRGFATALFYGVLERRMTLDYLIRYYSKIEFDKLEHKTISILRIGLYQLLYMNSVPDNAAVNEAVGMCQKSTSGFVNAILRNFIRDSKKVPLTNLYDEAKLSIEYSCPKWIVKRWIKSYGEQTAVEVLSASFGRPPLYVKANTLRATIDDIIAELKNDDIVCTKNKLLTDCLEIERLAAAKPIEETAAFRKGLFHVQDISSQLCCKIIQPKFTETVIDLCAAPGGKSFTMAQQMNNTGEIISCDLYDGKLSLLSEGAKRLGVTIIKPIQNDASVYNDRLPLADKVICDVPCSGLGVIRRKPEIKYKPMESLDNLPKIQKSILNTAAKYVKPGGSLFYSTCTLNPSENEDVLDNFLQNNPNFSPVIIPLGISGVSDAARRNFFPHITGGDGFFIGTFRRIK